MDALHANIGSVVPGGAGDTNYTSMIGNKMLLKSIRFRGQINIRDDQSTEDQWIGRITVLRVRSTYSNQIWGTTSSTNYNIVRNLYLGYPFFAGQGLSTDLFEWWTLPWDKKKVKVYYDKRIHRHAFPSTVQPQVDCNWKSPTFNINLNFKRGMPMVVNHGYTAIEGDARWINPILIIIQGDFLYRAALPVSSGGAGWWTLHPSTTFYTSFYDL